MGFECRPIVAGNFTKNDVVKYFDTEIDDDFVNANLIDTHGLFIGNHHGYEKSDKFNRHLNFYYGSTKYNRHRYK